MSLLPRRTSGPGLHQTDLSNYTPNDFSSLVPTKFLLSASLDKEFWLREMDHSSEEVAD